MSLDFEGASSKMWVPDPAELRWCSKSGRTAPPKRICKKKLLRFITQYKLAFRRKTVGVMMEPSVQIVYADERRCDKKKIFVCVKIALSSWNEKSLSQQGPEYELVEPLGAFQYQRQMLYHCNFTARPKNTSEAENKLFFAELQYISQPENNGQYDLLCQFCCILGPSGCETGLSYCTFCEMDPHGRCVVHHPEAGFTKAGFKYTKSLDVVHHSSEAGFKNV